MPRTKTQPKTLTPDEIIARLRAVYGEPQWRPHHDATAELVLTLLSQNTSDSNSGRAFSRLLQRFPDWQSVIEAPLSEVEDAIRPGGLAPTKAPRLQAMLAEVKSRTGGFDLRFLTDMPVEEAREWLRTLPAVGPKTAACVLLFGLGMPGLPVDTHVFRVSTRLGLVEEKMGPDKAQTYLEALVPPEDHFGFHVLLIRHGRHCCSARNPNCAACPLRPDCPAAPQFIASK
ncbi:MAG TPA: endonuclease III [Dehalococcoidia bacterium]|nr:endonuclease III [Dehalococcoidia bacterium]